MPSSFGYTFLFRDYRKDFKRIDTGLNSYIYVYRARATNPPNKVKVELERVFSLIYYVKINLVFLLGMCYY